MKKTLISLMVSLAMFVGIVSQARAQEVSVNVLDSINFTELIKKLPDMKQGVAYSFVEDEFEYINTIKIANKFGLNVEVGYASESKLLVALTGDIVELKDYINLPILDLVKLNIGLYYAIDRINNLGSSEDYGATATFLEFKFN